MAVSCVVPGSFDPVTRGHMDIIRRAAAIFDRVIVGVLNNPDKTHCFTAEKRAELLRRACAELENVCVKVFDGLLVDFMALEHCTVCVRGVRDASELDAQHAMAQANRMLDPRMDTLLLCASPDAGVISASMVKQIASFGGDVRTFLPSEVAEDIIQELQVRRNSHDAAAKP